MNPTSRSPRPLWRLAVAVAVLAAVGLAACSSKKGPDLSAALGGLPSLTRSAGAPTGVDGTDGDGFWTSGGSVAETADVISAKSRPDERTTGTNGDQFLLYPSGTVWVTESGGKAAVVLYKDNQRAYRRHTGALVGAAAWSNRMNGYGGGGGSNNGGSGTGNGFRGGGSGSGK